ncbi:MAG: glycosyltransferase [Anaerolineae bacterium]|nr:MAG: glycosyltransferase [Anaerolineae bacterium]
MNILQISTLSHRGGAARVMYRLHQDFRHQGHHSIIAARSVQHPEIDVYALADLTLPSNHILRRVITALDWRMERKFAIAGLHPVPQALLQHSILNQSEVVHLHNLHGYYFNYGALDALATRKPVVWTLHDMWAFTGHCAYAYDCTRWQSGCGNCPLLQGKGRALVEPAAPLIDCTAAAWRKKRAVYRRTPLEVVAPSRWLQRLAQASIIGQGRIIHHIPNGIDLEIFKPCEQVKARHQWNIPLNKLVILFSAEKTSNPRKGFAFLREALMQLPNRQNIVLLVMGAGKDTDFPGFHVIHLGYLKDEYTQAAAYNAADLMVFPSLADNQPLGILESLACGTPVVAFNTGGIPEMVRHMETGYLAHYKDTYDLCRGIQTLGENPTRLHEMRAQCRRVAQAEYALSLQAQRYLSLYEQAIDSYRHDK